VGLERTDAEDAGGAGPPALGRVTGVIERPAPCRGRAL
jgi:hypothetical protein